MGSVYGRPPRSGDWQSAAHPNAVSSFMIVVAHLFSIGIYVRCVINGLDPITVTKHGLAWLWVFNSIPKK